jgi:N-acyl-D-aspartate/D-glutamate deacylase
MGERPDVVIRGGTIVDGTGAAARPGDVAIDGGRIVAVGDDVGRGTREIDARGAIVTPGFIDLHCHYDGQASWDDAMLPSSVHGVTTALLGNCGVGFAPVRPHDHDRLIRLMEGVEDIPGTALTEGLRWGWESFGEYMDALSSLPRTIDLCLQVPHDALRLYVMGDRAETLEEATDDDVAQMAALLRAALEAGAAGFSTGRTDNHRTADGKPTPASESTRRELEALGAAFRGLGHGVLQAVSDFDMDRGPARFDAEFDLLEAMARASGGRPLSVSTLQRDVEPGQWRRILTRIERATAAGVPMHAQVAPRAIGVILGLEASFHPFMGFPSYKAIAHLPLADRVARLRDPALRARLLDEKSERLAGDGSPIPPLADRLLEAIDLVAMRLFRLGDPPSYEPPRAECLFAEAMARGVPTLHAVYDALLERDGEQLLYFPLYNYTEGNLDVAREMMAHPLALVALSDGGAHVGTVCDASMTTFMLTHWARDRASGRLSVEEAVHAMTARNAAYLGLRDRGVIREGARADLNVIDHAALTLERPRLVRDLPAGGKRFVQGARGYRATLVAGEPIVLHDALTSARPGRVVRCGGA